MYKKTITYEDFEGNEVTKDFYFSLTESEITEMETSVEGGYGAYLKKIAKEKDTTKMIEYMKFLIGKAYGLKTEFGFTKTAPDGAPAIRYFEATNAFSELFMLLATNDVEASEFCKGILPKKLRDKVTDEAIAEEMKSLSSDAT